LAVLRFAIILSLALVPAIVSAEEHDPWMGKSVVLKPNAVLTKHDKPIDPRFQGFPTTVLDADQDRVWLGRAWAKKADAMDLDEALAFCDERLKANRKDAVSWHLRGVAWFSKGELFKAAYSLDEAIRLNPTFSQALADRGLALGARQDYDAANRDFEAAIRLDSTNPMPHLYRGFFRKAKKQFKEAAEDFDRCIELDPECTAAFKLRGDLAWISGDFESAISAYNDAIRHNPKSATSLGNRAFCWLKLQDPDQALRDIDKAIQINPKAPGAHCLRSACWLVKGDCDKALEDMTKGIGLNPNNPFPYVLRARMYRSVGKDREAIGDYETLSRLDPKNPVFITEIVWVLSNSEDSEVFDVSEAFALANKAWEMTDGKHLEAVGALAAAHAADGDWENAIRLQKEAIEMTPPQWQMFQKESLQKYENHQRGGPTKEQFKKTVEDMFFGQGPIF
jgi:tetratricopeptide (TPR) repeat protein